MKKEIVYILPYETEKNIKAAEKLLSSLYEKFNSVQTYSNGLYEVRIVAEDEIVKKKI